MTADNSNQVLRLPKRHSPASDSRPDPEQGVRLMESQSLRGAIVASLIVIILFSAAWAMLSVAIGRVFPWMTLLLALFIGLTVRRAGRGLDWRFPVVAAVATLGGALVGNVVIAAAFTAAEYETGTLTILRAVTAMTWPVFFDEVITAADFIYALFGAALAAFYANRRLSREQYAHLRAWQQELVSGSNGAAASDGHQ